MQRIHIVREFIIVEVKVKPLFKKEKITKQWQNGIIYVLEIFSKNPAPVRPIFIPELVYVVRILNCLNRDPNQYCGPNEIQSTTYYRLILDWFWGPRRGSTWYNLWKCIKIFSWKNTMLSLVLSLFISCGVYYSGEKRVLFQTGDA